MSKKITWEKIRDEFKRCHPRLHKRVSYWRPYDYATIVLYFKDGEKATFNYDTKEVMYLSNVD